MYNDFVATGSSLIPVIGFPSWTQVATFFFQEDRKIDLNIPKGFILKPRKIADSWVAHAPPVVRETWDWLLMNVNHTPSKYNGYELLRGQTFCQISEIIEGLSWHVGYRKQAYSVNQMKHTLKLLRTHSMIVTTNHPRGMLISVCNYDKYQSAGNYESTNESTDESTNDQPRVNQSSPSINKNDKNIKKEKNEKYSDADLQSASGMYQIILGKYPQTKKPNFEVWANHFRLMREIDKRTPDQIDAVFRWANEDDFWSPNILSPAKLRKQFDTLSAKMQSTPTDVNSRNAETLRNFLNG